MKYMALIYGDPSKEPGYGTPEFQKMMGDYFAFNERLKADGVDFSGEGLQGIETATSLRLNGGKVETMDGPFAETKELIGRSASARWRRTSRAGGEIFPRRFWEDGKALYWRGDPSGNLAGRAQRHGKSRGAKNRCFARCFQGRDG